MDLSNGQRRKRRGIRRKGKASVVSVRNQIDKLTEMDVEWREICQLPRLRPLRRMETRQMASSTTVERLPPPLTPISELRNPAQPVNPLHIELIVREIVSYLDPITLKACRRVNRQWNRYATEAYRKNHTPIFLTKSNAINNFHRAMSKSTNMPFTFFGLRCRLSSRICNYFRTFGHSVHSIQIYSRLSICFTFDDLFKLVRELVNLKTLKLVNIVFPNQKQSGPCSSVLCRDSSPNVMEKVESLQFSGWFLSRTVPTMGPLSNYEKLWILEVYKSTPNVKKLELSLLRTTIVTSFLSGLHLLKNLEKLTIQSVGEGDMSLLLDPANFLPKLKSLTLREVQMTRGGDHLLSLMQLYSNTLEHFAARVFTSRDVRIVKFPVMKVLKVLTLDTLFTTDNFIIEEHTGGILGDPFPCLHQVVLSQAVLRALIEAKFKSFTVQHVVLRMNQAFTVGGVNALQDDLNESGHDSRQSSIVGTLAEIFPDLKKLRIIDAKMSAIRAIFEKLTKLEHLEIYHFETCLGLNVPVDLNPVLTGIPQPIYAWNLYDKFRSLGQPSPVEVDVARRFLKTVSPISIRNLTQLKILVLSGLEELDNSGVHLALLPLQRLDRLTIAVKLAKFGPETLTLLRKRHSWVQIKPVPPQETEAYLDMAF